MKIIKYLLPIILMACTKSQPATCMDGYFIIGNNITAFCQIYDISYGRLRGYQCYGVSNLGSPKAKANVIVLSEGEVLETKCYNADRD
jgi:hypothetical protein